MDLKDLAGKVLPVAQILGGALGGPAGLAISAATALAKAFGLAPDATPGEIDQAIQKDPQAALKFRIAEMDFQLEVNRQKLQETEIHLKDVQNARQREIEIVKTTGRRDMLQFWLAVFGWLAPVALIGYLVIYGLPKGISTDAAALIGGFIGIIIGEYKTIYQYFFGSSAGSAQKSEIISKIKGQ